VYGRLIAILVAVTLGLIATVFFFNWLWIRAFGPAMGPPMRGQQVENRKALREEHAAREAAKREKARYSPEILNKAAQVTPPRALNATEFDPRTGRVHWPELLLAAEYELPRGELEQWLRDRASDSVDDKSSENARSAAARMHSILRENIKSVPADEYIAARSFLESLMQSIQPERPAR
jgi:hypothetical protein